MKMPFSIGMLCLLFSSSVFGQAYTYLPESFEANVWSIAPSSANTIVSSTGSWTTAKSNIQTTAIAAQEGDYSLVFANKGNALITPFLSNGAGVLTYYLAKVSSRSVMISTSADKLTWSSTIDSVAATSTWTKRTVIINNYGIKYIRFQSNSNSGLYIDNVLITPSGVSGVTTLTAPLTQINQTNALASGSITSDGSHAILSRGFCYDTNGNPDTASMKVYVPGTTGIFSTTLSNLAMGTVYYVKAFAATASGVSYGPVVLFTTRSADKPITYWTQPFNDATNLPAVQPTTPVTIDVPNQGAWIYYNAYKSTNPLYITDKSVSCLRLLKSGSYVTTPLLEDGVTELTFSEGRGERDLTISTSVNGGTSWTTLPIVTTVKGQIISVVIKNGSVNRVRISNNSTSDADIDNIALTVFPSGTVPTLSSSSVYYIGKNQAVCGGEVLLAGSKPLLGKGVCWSTETTPIIADNSVPILGTTLGIFSSPVFDLPAGTTIHMRTFAFSRAGVGYSDDVVFTTLPPTIPRVGTGRIRSIKGEYALGAGGLIDWGGAPIIHVGTCWSTTGVPTTSSSKTSDSLIYNEFQSTMSPLLPNTKYYFRAYAENIAGTGYGDLDSIKTGSIYAPSVTTSAVDSVYFYKAVGAGKVVSDGNALTQCGLCWNTTGAPTLNDSKIFCESDTGYYKGTMTGLTENTMYYVRAFAINSVKTVYGEEVTFSTPVSTKLSKPIGFGEGTTGGGIPTVENTVLVKTASELTLALTGSKSVILISGTIATNRMSAVLVNKTILGLPGARLVNLDQTAVGSGILHLTEGSRNVIIQNLIFEGPGAYDCDGWDLLTNKGCNKLWVDHCEFQDGVDDCFDNTNSSDSITVSWCKFTYLKPAVAGGSGGSDDHRFANLIGGSDSDFPADGHYSVTWQNCWWATGVTSRMIRGRNAEVHMLNCYWNSPNTSSAIGLTAGTNGSTIFVEGGVFACPGTIADISTGDISIKYVDCIGGKTSLGTVPTPTYEYLAMQSAQVAAVVSDGTCGAGATLVVTAGGDVFSSCPTVPILSIIGSNNQVVYEGNALSTVVFTWGGTATDVTITDLPAGLTVSKDVLNKTVTIGGKPTASGTLTITTVGGTGLPATRKCTVTLTTMPPATLNGTLTIQTVNWGSAMVPSIFTWGGGATSLKVSSLPRGLNALLDSVSKTLIVSGTPVSSGDYLVSTVGGSGNVLTLTGRISIKYGASVYKVAYVTNPTSATYMNDVKIFPALANDPNLKVTEVDAGVSGNDYSSYDLVVFSEVANSTDPGVVELKGLDKPMIMMKVHSYKVATGAWNWSATTTAYNQSATDTRISVLDKTNSMFKDVNWLDGNQIQMLTDIGSLKGLTYMNPLEFKTIVGGTITSLATMPGQPTQVCIFTIPKGLSVAGTLIPKPFIQIGINSNSYALLTEDAVSIVKNACFQLLDLLNGATFVQKITTTDDGISNLYCYTKGVTMIRFSADRCGKAKLFVRDVSGKLLFNNTIDYVNGFNETTIDLRNLHTGLYFISLETPSGKRVSKLIL
jgi:pectate lyase